ncbi:hypothetical protein C457_11186 [Haloferax prahovense DSM 18310]|uniref:HTH arsR-type domain-containing protein n=1 Tax=Haloferax prahovense (strain DSM 18310 / JCM 13924 / TL6) TaxID=1227461 RepID=M0GCN8_HALPT|nr:hypothetical protein [Haloferax prahovense]ELZ68564.1 hypothetical protein C457_11186 [Haloferax prahovense DSM 18310]
MGDNKQNRFEEAFERGQKGQISSYDAWLQNQGVNPDNLSHEYITAYLQKHPEEAPSHDDQLEEVAEYIGFFSQQKGTYHLPIIAPAGFGKTQLLHTINQMTEQLNLDYPNKYYSTTQFVEEQEEELGIYKILDELEEYCNAVVLLDDCGQDKRIDHSLKKINSRVDNLLIITSWTPEHWALEQDRVNDVLPLSQVVELSPLSEKNTVDALKTAVSVYSSGQLDLPKSLYSEIYSSSYGIPLLFHEILRETFKQSFLSDFSEVTTEAVSTAVQNLQLDGVQERVYDLSDKKLLVLKHVLLSPHPKGQRPSELVEKLNRDKSTISYHLQSLTDNRILEKEKQGRSVFYRVRDLVKPLLQQRIEKEGEFYA